MNYSQGKPVTFIKPGGEETERAGMNHHLAMRWQTFNPNQLVVDDTPLRDLIDLGDLRTFPRRRSSGRAPIPSCSPRTSTLFHTHVK